MIYKAVVLDFDGTLTKYDSTGFIRPPWTIFRILQDRDIAVIFATGRGYYFMRSILETSFQTWSDYLICHDGALIIHPLTGEILLEKFISFQIVEKIKNYCKTHHLDYYLNTQDGVYFDHTPLPCTSSLAPFQKKQSNLIEQRVLQIYIRDLNDNHLPLFSSFLRSLTLRFYTFPNRRSTTSSIICHPSASKKEALTSVLSYLSIPEEDVMIFGDGENDLDLFTLNSTNIAVHNAVDALKKCASFVLPEHTDPISYLTSYYGL